MLQMKKIILISVVFCSTIPCSLVAQENDKKALEELIHSITTGVNDRDHQMILDAFIHPTALIYSTFQGLSSPTFKVESNTAQGLSDFIRDSEDVVKQKFEDVEVNLIDKGRATVTTYYYVTINDKKSHKGEEFYSVIKTTEGWKCVSLIFTLEAWK